MTAEVIPMVTGAIEALRRERDDAIAAIKFIEPNVLLITKMNDELRELLAAARDGLASANDPDEGWASQRDTLLRRIDAVLAEDTEGA